MNIQKIIINKNRGWRGLSELKALDAEGKTVTSMVFSFSPEVWKDMLAGYIVLPYKKQFIVLHFNNTHLLPKGQRSVLIKDFTADVLQQYEFDQEHWMTPAIGEEVQHYIVHFKRNENNHTKSDWNCIGIRVTPKI